MGWAQNALHTTILIWLRSYAGPPPPRDSTPSLPHPMVRLGWSILMYVSTCACIMYVCMYVCMHVCMYKCALFACLSRYVYMFTSVCTGLRNMCNCTVRVCAHVYIYIYMYRDASTPPPLSLWYGCGCIYVRKRMCLYVCTNVSM